MVYVPPYEPQRPRQSITTRILSAIIATLSIILVLYILLSLLGL